MTNYGGEALAAAPGAGTNGGVSRLVGGYPMEFPVFGPRPAPVAALPVEILRQQAAAALQYCYRWLEAAAPAVPQVAGLVPALVTAVAQYEAQQYDACLGQTAAVIQAFRQLHLSVPNLPPL